MMFMGITLGLPIRSGMSLITRNRPSVSARPLGAASDRCTQIHSKMRACKRRARLERAHVFKCAASQSDPGGAVEAVERASKLLDEIVQEVGDKVLIEGAVSEVMEEETGSDLSLQILKHAVNSRIELMDAGFLAALAAYKRAAEAKGDENTLRLINAIREEVLIAVSKKLPAPMQIVDLLVRNITPEERAFILTTSVGGGNSDIPACSPDEIALAVGQLIDEMEKMEQVPDWSLLLQLCHARELVRRIGLVDEISARQSMPPKMAMTMETSLVNALCSVGDPMRRKALLKRAFDKSRESELMVAEEKRKGGKASDEEMVGRRRGGMQPFEAISASAMGNESKDRAPGVRPGRYMDSLIGLLRQMKASNGPKHMIWNMKALLEESVEALEEMAAGGTGENN